MSTIKALYEKAGNPDLSHWKDIHLFSLAESALLTAGIDPLLYEDRTLNESLTGILKIEKPINWQRALMIIRALKQSVCLGEITCKIAYIERSNWNGEEWEEKIEQLDLTLEHLDTLNTHSTKISRREYRKWLHINGYLEQSQQNTTTIEANHTSYQQPQPVQDSKLILLPEPTYTTPSLEALHGVINEFWINYDPDKNQPPPKQDVVASWIMANYPDVQGKELCVYIDKICRHPTAKKGGNTKLNQPNKIKDITSIK